MLTMSEASNQRRIVEAVPIRLSTVTIKASEFDRLFEESQRTGKALESLLPKGLIPEGALVVTDNQARASWRQRPDFRKLLHNEGPALIKKLRLPKSDTYNTYELDVHGRPKEIDAEGFNALRLKPERREKRSPGPNAVVMDAHFGLGDKWLHFDANLKSDNYFRVAYYIPEEAQSVREDSKQKEELAGLRRVIEKGQIVVLTSPSGKRTEIPVPEGTTVHIE